MLAGHLQNGFSEEGSEFLSRHDQNWSQPNETTWITFISSCSLHGDPFLADWLLKLLDGKRVRMDLFVEATFLDMDAKCNIAGRISDELGEYNKRFGYS
ncbi:hypothetical protein OIU76_018809 [Salix suchowensis]|nr:hypothetical protein OIU76_018809 [Salix suchowensis]KAJ6342989.1 hypothetical protein OIU78_010832 [Salix suchowensis]